MEPKQDDPLEWLEKVTDATVADSFGKFAITVAGFYMGLVAAGMPSEVSIRLAGEYMQAMFVAARLGQVTNESEDEG